MSWHNGELTCSLLELGEYDASGRRVPVETGETVTIPADLVVAAVGERVDGETLAAYGVASEPRHGLPIVRQAPWSSSAPNIYVAGDARRGPSHRGGGHRRRRSGGRGHSGRVPRSPTGRCPPGGGEAMLKGILQEPAPRREYERCLGATPLRDAMGGLSQPGQRGRSDPHPSDAPDCPYRRSLQRVRNCAAFCPYDSAPYRDKLHRVFGAAADFQQSSNDGSVLLDPISTALVRVPLDGVSPSTPPSWTRLPLPSGIQELIETIVTDYSYLLY